MKIKTSTITFWFNKKNDLNQYLEKFNNAFEEYFYPFNIAGLPSNVDPNYPRMTAYSKSNHSNIEFSLISLRFNTNFDDSFNSKLDSCIDYLKTRAILIYNTLIECNIDIVYSAIFISMDEKADDPQSRIVSEFFDNKSYNNIDDVGIRLSSTLDNKYYKNLNVNTNKKVSFRNVVSHVNEEILIPLLSLEQADQIDNYLMTSVEINDKLLFNIDHNHKTSTENLYEMFDHLTKELAQELDRF